MDEIFGKAFQILKRLITSPRKTIHALFFVLNEKSRTLLINPMSKSGLSASLYFTFFSTRFYREHKAVLAGIAANKKGLDLIHTGSSARLRRNIHRIEKGLSMVPRRDVFAEDYIGETVDMFVGSKASNLVADEELNWARDVLFEYFSNVKMTNKIEGPSRIFQANSSGKFSSQTKKIPYQSATRKEIGVSYDQLRDLLVRRRSVRWYENRQVPKELIHKAVEAASFAASACNRQPYSFIVIDEPQYASKIAEFAGGTVGFSSNIQCLAVVIGDLSYYVQERDRHLIYIDAAMAAAQFMMALETLELSSCPINWPDVEDKEKALQAELNLEIYQRPIMFISVGYPASSGLIPFSQKKGADVMIRDAQASS